MTFRRGAAFTLIELLAVILIIIILASILLPVIHVARENVWNQQCRNNLHNLGQEITAFALRNGRLYPAGGATLTAWLCDRGVSTQNQLCPSYRKGKLSGVGTLWDYTDAFATYPNANTVTQRNSGTGSITYLLQDNAGNHAGGWNALDPDCQSVRWISAP